MGADASTEPPCRTHRAYTPHSMDYGVVGNSNACFQTCLEHHMTLIQSHPPHNLSCGLESSGYPGDAPGTQVRQTSVILFHQYPINQLEPCLVKQRERFNLPSKIIQLSKNQQSNYTLSSQRCKAESSSRFGYG